MKFILVKKADLEDEPDPIMHLNGAVRFLEDIAKFFYDFFPGPWNEQVVNRPSPNKRPRGELILMVGEFRQRFWGNRSNYPLRAKLLSMKNFPTVGPMATKARQELVRLFSLPGEQVGSIDSFLERYGHLEYLHDSNAEPLAIADMDQHLTNLAIILRRRVREVCDLIASLLGPAYEEREGDIKIDPDPLGFEDLEL